MSSSPCHPHDTRVNQQALRETLFDPVAGVPRLLNRFLNPFPEIRTRKPIEGQQDRIEVAGPLVADILHTSVDGFLAGFQVCGELREVQNHLFSLHQGKSLEPRNCFGPWLFIEGGAFPPTHNLLVVG